PAIGRCADKDLLAARRVPAASRGIGTSDGNVADLRLPGRRLKIELVQCRQWRSDHSAFRRNRLIDKTNADQARTRFGRKPGLHFGIGFFRLAVFQVVELGSLNSTSGSVKPTERELL